MQPLRPANGYIMCSSMLDIGYGCQFSCFPGYGFDDIDHEYILCVEDPNVDEFRGAWDRSAPKCLGQCCVF